MIHTTQINFYTTELDLNKQYLKGLQLRKIDEKFKYIGQDQAKSWLDVCMSKDYHYYRESLTFLDSIKQDLASFIKSDVNVIALGPGDGVKDSKLIKQFLQEHQASFIMVDLSKELINITLKNSLDLHVTKEAFVADILDINTLKVISNYVRRNYYPVNFFTLLGNTLGNYPQAIITKVLCDTLRPEDYVLIGVYVKSSTSIDKEAEEVSEIIQGYDNPLYKKQVIASLARAGIEPSDGDVEIEYGKNKYFPTIDIVTQYFKFNRSRIIRYFNDDIYFAKDERILVGYSNKYTISSLENILSSHGLRIVRIFQDYKTSNYVKLLCQLT